MNWDGVPLGRGVAVVARDANGLGALDKPAGVLSMPNRAGEESRAVVQAAYEEKGESFVWEGGRLWLLNRLDSATSGVLLVADNAEMAAAIKDQFKRRAVKKIYQALVFGRPAQPAEQWRDRLAVDKRGGRIRTAPSGPLFAEADMRMIESYPAWGGLPPLSLLQLEPHTGRSHQLRVQCARRRLPIVGDQTYGDFPRNRLFAKSAADKRLFLHSLSTSFRYRWRGAEFDFAAAAPLPWAAPRRS